MRYILTLDQGATSSRALLADEQGRLARMAQREFRQIFPQPGWVEQDSMDILQSQLDAAAGIWMDRDEIRSLRSDEDIFPPKMPAAGRDRLCARWQKAVSRARDWEDEGDG